MARSSRCVLGSGFRSDSDAVCDARAVVRCTHGERRSDWLRFGVSPSGPEARRVGHAIRCGLRWHGSPGHGFGEEFQKHHLCFAPTGRGLAHRVSGGRDCEIPRYASRSVGWADGEIVSAGEGGAPAPLTHCGGERGCPDGAPLFPLSRLAVRPSTPAVP